MKKSIFVHNDTLQSFTESTKKGIERTLTFDCLTDSGKRILHNVFTKNSQKQGINFKITFYFGVNEIAYFEDKGYQKEKFFLDCVEFLKLNLLVIYKAILIIDNNN